MNGKIIIGLIILLLGGISEIKAETKEKILRIKITDSKKEPVFGVYVVYKAKSILLTTSDIDGECTINYSRFQPTDSLQFQGMGYETETHSIRDLILSPVVKLKELKYDLQEAVIRVYHGRATQNCKFQITKIQSPANTSLLLLCSGPLRKNHLVQRLGH